ncbi:MAG: hypothetical protein ACW9WZ_04135 [Nitrosopumilus sp.]|jgi:hypothetical protein
MTEKIEEELREMNRLKRLELEFLFFRANMDDTLYEKFRNELFRNSLELNEFLITEELLKNSKNSTVSPNSKNLESAEETI